MRFVSFDAGGLLQLVPILLLEDIEKETKKPLSSLVDGMMGSSSGALLAASLVVPDKITGLPKFSIADLKSSAGILISFRGRVFK